MSQKTIRFGIIGCGLMGREFASASARWCHLNDMKAKPEIVAICDTNPALFDWYTQHFASIKQTSTDYKELLANPDVDAIYCAVPHVLHEQVYIDILRAKKNLLGEKPFGMNLAQNQAILAELAHHPELLVRCSSELPFYPGAMRVFDALKKQEMGDIVEVEAGFLHSSDINPDKPINWKRMVEINGEYGCLGDLGMHVLHVPLRLGWKPTSVYARLNKLIDKRPDGKGNTVPCTTWDNGTLHTTVTTNHKQFPMNLKMWRIAPGESNTWYIKVLGTQKSFYFSTKNPRQWQWMDYQKGGVQEWRTEDLGYTPNFPTITGGIFEFGFTDSILQMWAAFVDECAGGDAHGFHCATPQETTWHHEVLTAALQSQATNQVINL